jgi:hypothetical protein
MATPFVAGVQQKYLNVWDENNAENEGKSSSNESSTGKNKKGGNNNKNLNKSNSSNDNDDNQLLVDADAKSRWGKTYVSSFISHVGKLSKWITEDPKKAIDVLVEAVNSERPATRYYPGYGSKGVRLFAALPVEVVDTLFWLKDLVVIKPEGLQTN